MSRWRRLLIVGVTLIALALLWAVASLPSDRITHEEGLCARVGVGMTTSQVEQALGVPESVEEGAAPDGGTFSTRMYHEVVTVDFYAPPDGVGILKVTRIH